MHAHIIPLDCEPFASDEHKPALAACLLAHIQRLLSVTLPFSCTGVPIKRPIAGIAMGLILEPDGRFAVLSDILGSEDALGDMDFKVAGDNDSVTAFQMDIKVRRMCVSSVYEFCKAAL